MPDKIIPSTKKKLSSTESIFLTMVLRSPSSFQGFQGATEPMSHVLHTFRDSGLLETIKISVLFFRFRRIFFFVNMHKRVQKLISVQTYST